MHDTQTNFTTIACSQCHAPAMLRVVVPSEKPGYEARRYECTICKHSKTLLVEIKHPARRGGGTPS